MKVARDSAAGWRPRPSAVDRQLARAWRELTGGTGRDREHERRTLIACSGGGDSAGMVLALVAAVSRAREVFVVGHVVHDLRPRRESLADRDSARELAERLGLEFFEAEVKARGRGNLEAAARKLRYAALTKMAVEADCGFIATAHHAEDQLETMLMAMVRGAGPRGMAGIAGRRRLGEPGDGGPSRVRLIRPALGIGRDELRGVCSAAGWQWREDATNADESRLRSAIRARVLPELERIRPGAAKRASRGAALLRGAAHQVRGQAKRTLAGSDSSRAGEGAWGRADLRMCPEVVLGELIRLAGARFRGGNRKEKAGGQLDCMTASGVGRIARAIRDRSTDPRVFKLGGVVVEVTARQVVIKSDQSGPSRTSMGAEDE